MKLRRRPEQKTDIDISPLIDMVFILLIFFMVSTTFVKDMKVDIERPAASTATNASSKALRINIDSGSKIYIDGNPIRPWMVQSRVRDFVESTGNGSVLVVTDKGVPADRLIEVIDQCRLAGVPDVGVATEKEAG